MLRCPTTNAGSGLPAVKPVGGGIDGAPLSVTDVAVVSTNAIGADGFYIYSTTPLHLRLSTAGTPATTNDAPIPAGIPLVFYSEFDDKISLIKMSGAADGTCWVHACATFD